MQTVLTLKRPFLFQPYPLSVSSIFYLPDCFTSTSVVFGLKQSQTSVEYSLAKAGSMKISTYNIKGQLVKKESYPTMVKKGSLIWTASDKQGRELPNGIYLIRMEADDEVFMSRVMVVK